MSSVQRVGLPTHTHMWSGRDFNVKWCAPATYRFDVGRALLVLVIVVQIDAVRVWNLLYLGHRGGSRVSGVVVFCLCYIRFGCCCEGEHEHKNENNQIVFYLDLSA